MNDMNDTVNRFLRGIIRPVSVILLVFILYTAGQIILFSLWNLILPALKMPIGEGRGLRANGFGVRDFAEYVLTALPFFPALLITERRIVKRRIIPELFPGSRFTRIDILAGLLYGPVLFSLAFLVFRRVGWLSVAGGESLPFFSGKIFWTAMVFLIVSLFEEILARGFILSVIAASWGFPAGTAFSSLLFSLMHLGNPNVNLAGLIGILGAGVWLGIAYFTTGSLYFPIALHFGWNMAQALLGFPVSGLKLPSPISVTITGPALWTGGAFGPEGGVAGYILILAGICATLGYGKLRNKREDSHLPRNEQ